MRKVPYKSIATECRRDIARSKRGGEIKEMNDFRIKIALSYSIKISLLIL